MGLMVMRRRDPEWSSYGSEEKGEKYCYQIHVDDAAGREKGENPLKIYIYPNAMEGNIKLPLKLEEIGEN